jgi:ABC-type uncharacterized transport system permease subunit
MTTLLYINDPEFFVTTDDFDFENLSKYVHDLYKHRIINSVNIDNIEYLPGNLLKVYISVHFDF